MTYKNTIRLKTLPTHTHISICYVDLKAEGRRKKFLHSFHSIFKKSFIFGIKCLIVFDLDIVAVVAASVKCSF